MIILFPLMRFPSLQLLREDRHAELSTRPIYHSAELLANWTV